MEAVTVSSFVILTVSVELDLTPPTRGLSINPVVNEAMNLSPYTIILYKESVIKHPLN